MSTCNLSEANFACSAQQDTKKRQELLPAAFKLTTVPPTEPVPCAHTAYPLVRSLDVGALEAAVRYRPRIYCSAHIVRPQKVTRNLN